MLFAFNDINKSMEEYKNTAGAALIDVREADEFRGGHIPGAVNIPLSTIGSITLPKDTPLFIYCLSGMRSKKAADILKQKGYNFAKSIGGIKSYKGAVEK